MDRFIACFEGWKLQARRPRKPMKKRFRVDAIGAMARQDGFTLFNVLRSRTYAFLHGSVVTEGAEWDVD